MSPIDGEELGIHNKKNISHMRIKKDEDDSPFFRNSEHKKADSSPSSGV